MPTGCILDWTRVHLHDVRGQLRDVLPRGERIGCLHLVCYNCACSLSVICLLARRRCWTARVALRDITLRRRAPRCSIAALLRNPPTERCHAMELSTTTIVTSDAILATVRSSSCSCCAVFDVLLPASVALSGSATRTCQDLSKVATWSGTLSQCIINDCGVLAPPANGQVNHANTTYLSVRVAV